SPNETTHSCRSSWFTPPTSTHPLGVGSTCTGEVDVEFCLRLQGIVGLFPAFVRDTGAFLLSCPNPADDRQLLGPVVVRENVLSREGL
ncbi:uncharacterized, partial [Tachysurus ichikawai]